MSSKVKIVIDITVSQNACCFKRPEEIIQQKAMKSFFSHVDQLLTKAKRYEKQIEEATAPGSNRHNNTITIIGTRGSGKTTFLLNMLHLIQSNSVNHTASNLAYDDLNSGSIELLDIIDPTATEDKEHVFLNILARIQENVAKACDYQSKEYHTIQHSYAEKHLRRDDTHYRDWQQCFQKLARGLPVIDGIGGNSLQEKTWQDPIHVVEQGLANVKAGHQLEYNFHQLVYLSLKLLKKKAFLLAFDDIDTLHTSSGWQVLETIRKYLTTPQIIIVLPGDLSLYSMLVREMLWKSFGSSLLRNESQQRQQFQQIINQREDHYFLKNFKPEYRITLTTLKQYVDGDEYDIYSKATPYSGKP